MGLTKGALFFFLATLSLSSAFITLVPQGKELVYHYKALVKAGTHYPSSHVSQYVLQGKLHIQSNGNASLVQFTDLTYNLYNGILDHHREYVSHEMPIPTEVQDLQKPFKIVYDPQGKVVGISIDSNETEYVKNMKKAIASILQLDVDQIVTSVHVPHAFVTQEHSIYGHGQVNYNVLPQGDVIHVQKMHEMRTSHHTHQYMFRNLEPIPCDTEYVEPLMHDSQRRYVIVKDSGHQIVKHIEADGGIYYYPYEAKSDMQYVLVNQTFDLVNIIPSQHSFTVSNVENDLTYHMFDFNTITEAIPDVTNGRKVVDYGKLLPLVEQKLEDIVKYLDTDHIHTNTPNIEQGQLINRVQRLLMLFNVNKLEELHTHLSQKSSSHHAQVLNVFYQMLPLVGTKATTLLIKNFVMHSTISPEVTVQILQNLARNVKIPSQELVNDMEPIIHLPATIDWNVRKAAILCFGSLVHRAHQYQIKIHDSHSNEHYYDYHHVHATKDVVTKSSSLFEKYLIHYISKVKEIQDFRVQMVYLHGIYNMKLPVVVKHLEPAIKGQWWNNHYLRAMSLSAIIPVLVQDSDLSFQVLWPILCDQQEHTDLRIYAYYILIQSNPSESRLTNLYWALMHEPNDEVYNFHYTQVKSLVESVEPCKQALKMKAQIIFKYMQPPSHGVSTFESIDYKDVNFGFSGGIQGSLVHSNVSKILFLSTTSQSHHRYNEDYMVYIRIAGLNKHFNELFQLNVENVGRVLREIHGQNDFHIEVALWKHQHVVNVFYVDQNNMQDLQFLADFLIQDHSSVNTNNIYITYERYVKYFFATDLGTPAVFEYLMPSVQKNVVNINKDVVNKIVNVHVDNNNVRWMHYRHGLSFYNPIADVWQGINRYHSYNAIVPIYVDISLNTQQQSVKFSIKRHSDAQKDVIGLRTHVSQLVFIKDDLNRHLVKHCCPDCQDFTIVGHGNEYHNQYTLRQEDNLNTGLNYQVVAYDSDRYISNGTINHLIYSIAQPYTKSSNNLLTQYLLAQLNWHHYLVLLPQRGNLGLMIKYTPSTVYSVSNVDVTVRVNQEHTKDDYVYTPGSKWSTRVTYAVKNKEQSLKTWDMNAIVDMNPGHTVNNLKLHLTRIIPGQKDYKICVDGVKKWTQKGVSGHVNIAMSQSADGKCAKDDTVVDITMVGQHSHEQEHENHVYGGCNYIVPYSVKPYHTLECLADHTSLRQYVYNVKTTNVPSEFKKQVSQWLDYIKGLYLSYYTFQDEHHENIGENNFKVDVVYPMEGRQVDVQVVTQQHVYKLSGVPTQLYELGGWGLVPDNMIYSKWFTSLHSLGLVDHCVINHNHLHLNHHVSSQNVPSEWSAYVGDSAQNPKQVVFVKKVGENLAVKVVEKQHVLEIVPQGNAYTVTVNGQNVSDQVHYEDWVTLQVLKMAHHGTHTVVVTLPHIGIHLECDGQQINVIIPRTQHPWHGYCYMH